MSAADIILKFIIPSVGVVTSSIMAMSSTPAVRKAVTDQDLKDLNIFPYAPILINAVCWLVYGVSLKDVFVFFANVIGAIFGLYYFAATYSLASRDEQIRQLQILITGAIVLITLVFISTFIINDVSWANNLYGIQVNIWVLIMYSAPLSTILKVIQTKSSASLDPKLCTTITINTSLWTVYGAATGIVPVLIPNACGAFLGCIQLTLIAIFPRNNTKRSRCDDTNNHGVSRSSSRTNADEATTDIEVFQV